jgi:prepilin-type N-terminal cleavage/methylation domain-containing protein
VSVRPTNIRGPRRGFSLIELLIVVVMSGVLIGISGGALGRQIARDRVLRSANVVQGMLTEASQLAVRRNLPVRVRLNGTAVQIVDRASNTVLKQKNFGPDYDLRASLAFSPSSGITIFPSGRADAGLRIAVSGAGLSTTVSRTATGIVRRQ